MHLSVQLYLYALVDIHRQASTSHLDALHHIAQRTFHSLSLCQNKLGSVSAMPCFSLLQEMFLEGLWWCEYNVIYRLYMGAVCSICHKRNTKTVAMSWLWSFTPCVWACLCLPGCVCSCVWLSDWVWENGRGQNDSGPQADRMKERPCLLSVNGGHRQTSQPMIFTNQHRGFSTPSCSCISEE